MYVTANLPHGGHVLRDDVARGMRTGRHRNTALAAWRRTRAVELATQDFTYQQIADELGYANRGTVHRIVQRALESRLTEGVDQLRDLEIDRLDAMQAALWQAASAGDTQAATAIVKIIDKRCRLLGLYPATGQQARLSGGSVVLGS
jgi:hypothetical protein